MKIENTQVFGVGYVGDWNFDEHYRRNNLYMTWMSMIRRCYGSRERERRFYNNIKVDERWHNFTNFVEDYPNIIGYDKTKTQVLDKDIYGGMVYSLENCCLISRELNLFLTNNKKSCSLSTGVTYSKQRNKYCCQIKHNGKTINLGRFEHTQKGLMEAIDKYWSTKLLYLDEHNKTTDNRIYIAIKNKILSDWENNLKDVTL